MAAASKATAIADTADMPVPDVPVRSAEIVTFQPRLRPVLPPICSKVIRANKSSRASTS